MRRFRYLSFLLLFFALGAFQVFILETKGYSAESLTFVAKVSDVLEVSKTVFEECINLNKLDKRSELFSALYNSDHGASLPLGSLPSEDGSKKTEEESEAFGIKMSRRANQQTDSLFESPFSVLQVRLLENCSRKLLALEITSNRHTLKRFISISSDLSPPLA